MAAALRGEHIVIASADADADLANEAAEAAGALHTRFTFHNPLGRVRTEIKLYENGYLGLREHRNGCSEPERRFALGHLDPRPTLTRREPNGALAITAWSLVAAAGAAALAYFSLAPAITVPVAAGALLATVLGGGLYAYRTEERVQFLTRHGSVAVITLAANPGCLRACRTLVPRLIAEIQAAQKLVSGDLGKRLQAELREHYRLREIGVLSAADCSAAVQRILPRFR